MLELQDMETKSSTVGPDQFLISQVSDDSAESQ